MNTEVGYLHDTFGRLFQHWEVSQVAFPVFLAVVTGYFISNAIEYRGMKKRLFNEWRFIRRHIYPPLKKDGGGNTHSAWQDAVINCTNSIDPIIDEMVLSGYRSAADKIRKRTEKFKDELHTHLEQNTELIFARHGTDRGYELLDRLTDHAMRMKLREYFATNHDLDAKFIFTTRPCFCELIDAPMFRRIEILVRDEFDTLRGYLRQP